VEILESAQSLSDSLDNINFLLSCATPIVVGQLPSLRVRAMKALIKFLSLLDERCRQALLSGSAENKTATRLIQRDVADLRLLVNSHVTRWSPDAIRADPPGYKIASNHLQDKMRNILNYAIL